MNNITIAGNIGKDPETRYLPQGDAVLSFSIADNQGKDKPAIWWNCALFGKRAESLAPYLTKGTPVTVTGTVTQREYTDRDGNKRVSMDVRVNDITLQGGRQEARTGGRNAYDDARSGRSVPSGRSPNLSDMDDDIPF
ncbi:MAG: single-stranded DNA-binding protein [Oxalobacter sp.]|nr:single-stranded DNA-binding protein [Oxalobacter sp.]